MNSAVKLCQKRVNYRLNPQLNRNCAASWALVLLNIPRVKHCTYFTVLQMPATWHLAWALLESCRAQDFSRTSIALKWNSRTCGSSLAWMIMMIMMMTGKRRIFGIPGGGHSISIQNTWINSMSKVIVSSLTLFTKSIVSVRLWCIYIVWECLV